MNDTLLTALLGAGSALLGVIVSQAFALLKSHYDRKHDRQTVLRQKYESLADTLNNSLNLLMQGVGNPAISNANSDEIMGNLRHVYTLSLIYFPLLTPCIKKLNNCASDLNAELSLTPTDEDKIARLVNKFVIARDEFDQAIHQHAKDYT